MLFDPHEPNKEFDTDLFGSNSFGLSYHIENEGFRAVWDRKKLTDAVITTHLPITSALASAMFQKVGQRSRWGRQIAPKRWIYEIAGEPISAGQGRHRYGDYLREREILKHLLGRGFARGTTDVPNEFTKFDHEKGEWNYNSVRSLRLDVDQDAAWLTQDRDSIIREVRYEAEIARRLRLPYRAFRTGGRGHQAVVPTPWSLPHSLSSLMLWAYRMALEGRNDKNGAELDADNLHGLMRLPGGVHGRSGEIGLWIDHASGRLHSLGQQAFLMERGFDYPEEPEDGLWAKEEFRDPAVALIRAMLRNGIVQHHVLTQDEAARVLEEQADNPIAETCLRAIEKTPAARVAILLPPVVKMEMDEGADEDGATLPATAQDVPTPKGTIAVPDPNVSVAYGSVEWAARVWTEAWNPGEFWDWINMGGRRGILAAVILFGKEDAETALVNLSQSVPARSGYEQREREFTIRSLWKKFGLKEFTPYEAGSKGAKNNVTGDSDAEVEALASDVVQGLRGVKPKGKWKDTLASRVAITLLIGLRDSEDGTVGISLRDLATTINERWPETPTNHMRVKEMVVRLTSGPGRLYAAFRRREGATYKGEPDQYEIGPRLWKTPFGKRCRERYMDALAREFGDDGDQVGIESATRSEPPPYDAPDALPEGDGQVA